MTFVATTLLYPCLLAALCLGAGLLVDRAAGGVLPAALLTGVGAAALIGLSQLSTFIVALAPATPYVLVAAAVAGVVLARRRLGEIARAARGRWWLVAGPVACYAVALAPVLASGRPTFSSFMALADSAVHIMGADYLVSHGQTYAHLDLHSSYGQFVNDYYNTSYPSGADTLFGGSARLLGVSLMWAFQPFNAFMLASAFGPAWVLARRLGLGAGAAWAAALCAVVPALVYGYELIGSVKEIVALSMMLTAGALVVTHRRWISTPRGSIPLALVLAGGVSALGIAFGVWALVAVTVLAAVLAARVRAGEATAVRAGACVLVAACVGIVAALPTIVDIGGSLQVASNIASTGNPGNLRTPLHTVQVLGVWLSDSYKLRPGGTDRTLTDLLAAAAVLAAVLGFARLVLTRAAFAGWVALTLAGWLIVSASVTTWASAKTLMLTSPVVMLLAWGGVAALLRGRGPARPLAAALGAALLAGVVASDLRQYRSSNLAPTARYEALASLDARFKGQGPALFTDFDEYALYELRDLDVSGPDFVYPPPALAGVASGYGAEVDLDRASPQALAHWPLIIARRDPLQSRPPVAYMLWAQNRYYTVFRRLPGTPVAIAHVPLSGDSASQCRAIGALAAAHAGATATLVADRGPQIVSIDLASASRPARWGHQRSGFAMTVPGTLSASFSLPSAGVWRLWARGQFMPPISFAVDGRPIATVSGELSGNSIVPDTVQLRRVSLAAGLHSLSVRRSSPGLSPGGRGSAVLDAAFLAGSEEGGAQAPVAAWRLLCGRRYRWVELLAGANPRARP